MIPQRAHALLEEASVFESFSRIRVDEQIRFENVSCDRRIFHIRRKNSRFSITSGYVTGPKPVVVFVSLSLRVVVLKALYYLTENASFVVQCLNFSSLSRLQRAKHRFQQSLGD